jgi:hypothetical protein
MIACHGARRCEHAQDPAAAEEGFEVRDESSRKIADDGVRLRLLVADPFQKL